MSKKSENLPITSGLWVKNGLMRCSVMGLAEREKESVQLGSFTKQNRSEGVGL